MALNAELLAHTRERERRQQTFREESSWSSGKFESLFELKFAMEDFIFSQGSCVTFFCVKSSVPFILDISHFHTLNLH